jgi:hypothetical protein
MTGDKARNLRPGSYVRWNGPGVAEMGVVTSVGRFGVVIRWADGRQTSPLFNDMKRINQTDANGREIQE